MQKTTKNFSPTEFEKTWLNKWEEVSLFQGTVKETSDREKLYLLFAFAYPSGSGLHVGHVESKTALDILARFHRMQGKQVLFPVGWDAFGLPAENYAVKTGIPPVKTTKNAIDTFRRQIKRLAISYDWDTEIATCHPGYYAWTQWLFLQLYKKGMAYRGSGVVNWCPSCQTVLANEQVVDGECERCSTQVIQKQMEQWYFKITQYQEELLSGLDQVDWPHPTKQQQINWIGKKEGITITYPVQTGTGETVGTIDCFTTRPDTNFGATFVVIAPEHPFAQQVAQESKEVADYLVLSAKKTELERQQEGRKKTGVATAYFARNPLNNKQMPIWISDFVLAGFGTGAVVGVPGHDLRDFQFAKQFGIPVIRVVVGPDGDDSEITDETQVQEAEGSMINSEFLDGMYIADAIPKMMDFLEENKMGRRVTSYKIRDWLISRQRYWGAPIPVVYDPEGTPHLVKEEHLPWLLPTDVDFKPTGESPLRSSKEFIERTERLYGKGWRPEFDTMDTFVDSSWYFLRYVSARDEQVFANPELLNHWLSVDFYMIGPEHIVLHLLYARFFTKFLRDEGYLDFDEPFLKMRHQGMILGPDNKKMSKSKGNVISPDEVIEKFGADTLRTYEMFMGPIDADKPWDPRAVVGVYRFWQRLFSLVQMNIDALQEGIDSSTATEEQLLQVLRKLHKTIQKVTQEVPKLKFNTAIASMMELVTVWEKNRVVTLDFAQLSKIVRMMAPFAPFLAEELYQEMQKANASETAPQSWQSVHQNSWPSVDPELSKDEQVTIPVQVDGKLRSTLTLDLGETYDDAAVMNLALNMPAVNKWVTTKTLKRMVYVPFRVLSLVTK